MTSEIIFNNRIPGIARYSFLAGEEKMAGDAEG